MPFTQIIVGGDQQAGRLEAYRVDRAAVHEKKAYFQQYMNQPNKALRDLALHLFDIHGQLKPHLHGSFGPETDCGGLIFIRCVSMKPHQARDKMMSQAIKELLVKLQRAIPLHGN